MHAVIKKMSWGEKLQRKGIQKTLSHTYTKPIATSMRRCMANAKKMVARKFEETTNTVYILIAAEEK